MAGRAKYASLLEGADIRRWYENVARGSHVTADVYLRRLGVFCQSFGKWPKDLLSMSEADLLLDYISMMEREERAGSYVKSALKAVKSWPAHNGIEIRRKNKD